MYRKVTPRFQVTNENLKTQRRALLAVCAALLILSAVLGFFVIRGAGYEGRVQGQISQRMYSASAAAIDEVDRLGSIVTSNASARLARVRQHIYYMEQLNDLSISLTGNRLAPDDAFTVLNSDLETFEELLQQSTTTPLNARSLLITHLQALQTVLNQQ